jgi:hypothetical protein
MQNQSHINTSGKIKETGTWWSPSADLWRSRTVLWKEVKGSKEQRPCKLQKINKHQNNVGCKLFENGKKKGNLPIVLQEWQGLDLIKAIFCTTWEPYTKKELRQAQYFLTGDL